MLNQIECYKISAIETGFALAESLKETECVWVDSGSSEVEKAKKTSLTPSLPPALNLCNSFAGSA